MLKYYISLFSILILTSCSATPIGMDVKPKNEPTYNFTQSSELLACVGKYIDNSRGPLVDIFVSSIPDHTMPAIDAGFLTKNAVMMVTTAVDRLNTEKVYIVGNNGGLPNRHQVQILGAFTEINRTVKSSALSGDVAIPGDIDIGFGGDTQFNHIALDMALSEKNRLIPGTATSVSIQIYGRTGDVQIKFDDGGDFAAAGSIAYTAQEGIHSSQRLLVETSIALMMSRYYNIDMTLCLEKNQKDEEREIQNAYDKSVFRTNDNDKQREEFKPISLVKPQTQNKNFLTRDLKRSTITHDTLQGDDDFLYTVGPEHYKIYQRSLQKQEGLEFAPDQNKEKINAPPQVNIIK